MVGMSEYWMAAAGARFRGTEMSAVAYRNGRVCVITFFVLKKVDRGRVLESSDGCQASTTCSLANCTYIETVEVGEQTREIE